MRRNLGRKILCSILAAGICGSASLAMAANSGGEDIVIDDLPTYAGNNGTGSNNEIYFDDNTKDYKYVIGGFVDNDGVTENNSVIVSGSTIGISGEVNGGCVYGNGSADINSVIINSSTIDRFSMVNGGYVYGNGSAKNNIVAIRDSIVVGTVNGGYIRDNTEQSSANNNDVIIDDSDIFGSVNGGYINSNKSSGSANNNTVIISNSNITASSMFGAVKGGYVEGSGSADDNKLIIVNSKLVGGVYGGYVNENGDSASRNSVVIVDSTVSGIVVGGYAESKNAANTNNNSVTIVGNSDLTNAVLFGTNEDGQTENTLIIDGWSGTVKSINNFNSIKIESLAGGLNLKEGEKFDFVTVTESNSISGTIENADVTDIKAGVALEVDGTLGIDGNTINIDVEHIRAQEQTAITTEARAGVTAFVNQGAEVVADNLNMLSQSEEGINTFATVSGNNSKYDTGSYADINGWNSIIGIASTKEIGSDKLNYGAFFENGSGNYNTYNEIGGAGFRGDGNVLYNGGGVMVRLDKENGFYTEAAVRAGSVKNEAGKNLSDGQHTYDYETENAYYGGHIGIGKIFKLDNGKAWDVYGKYFHMHHEGDSVEIGKDTFEFDSVDSNKLRIGARFSEQQGEKLTSYYGLAWDYEFSGDVKGTAAGYDMHTPSLEGSTVIGEVGFRYTPGKESPWYFDANVKGYVGVQEGLSGSVQAVYRF